MTLPTITELTQPPVVGQWYLVPCVRYWWGGRLAWWPVIGPKHDDAEHLAFEQPHYHIDRRFLTRADFRRGGWRATRRHVREGRQPWYPADTAFAASPLSERPAREEVGVMVDGPLPPPVLKRRRCLVADVGFPTIERAGEKFERFHAAYKGRRCGRDADGHLICPHKGARLSSLAADRNGIVTCPLHGLAVNVWTGVVVKRARAEPRPALKFTPEFDTSQG